MYLQGGYGNNYMCKPLITEEDVEYFETKELINKIFKGSKVKLFASFLNREILSDEEREQIKKLLDENE